MRSTVATTTAFIGVLSAIHLLLPVVCVPQAVVEISSTESCRACRIEVVPLVRLGQDDGPGSLASGPKSIALDSRGRYFITQFAGVLPLVFDENGRFLRELGRAGEGPGEYRNPSLVRVSAVDSVYIVDPDLQRLSVLSPSLEFVRSTRISRIYNPSDAVVREDASLVLADQIPARDAVGKPLHRIAPDGSLEISYGSERPAYRVDVPNLNRRHIAAARGGGTWSAHTLQYTIELWSDEGRLLRTLRRRADWFPGGSTQPRPTPDHPPVPLLLGLSEDPAGRLWVNILVGDSSWTAGLTQRPGRAGGTIYSITDNDRFYDTVVEVIDPDNAALVASVRLDSYAPTLVSPELLAGYKEDDAGVPVISLFRMQLIQP